MFFRFAASLVLVVLVSIAGVWLEKQTLELQRAVSRQHYQCDVLLDMIVQLRLETQRLAAVARNEPGTPDSARLPRQPAHRERAAVGTPSEQQPPRLQLPAVFDPRGIEP